MSRIAWLTGLGLLICTPSQEAEAGPQLRAMAGGSASITTDPDVTELQSVGSLLQGEAEIFGIGKIFGVYARAQHNGMYSNLEFELAETAERSVSAIVNYERTLMIGPTAGVKVGPLRVRLGLGGAVIESDLSSGTFEEIQMGTGHMIYERATSYGMGGELRADLNIPLIKPYAVARYLSTTADSTDISGGDFETLDASAQAAQIAAVADRQRLEAVVGVRFSALPMIQLGFEGAYGLNLSSVNEPTTWYSIGLGAHLSLKDRERR